MILAAVLIAAMEHGPHGGAPTQGMRTPTAAFDATARVWRVWTEDGHIWTSVSSDRGKTYRERVRVTREPETVDANGEARPKIAPGPRGEVYVSWTRTGKKPYTGDIRFSRSLDGGRTFDAARTINDDGVETGHRFDALAVTADGAVHLAWIDKRDLDRAKAAKQAYDGAALYHAVSSDRGATFSANRKIKDNVCECCRIAQSVDAQGKLVYLWRDVMPGNVRDHAMVRVDKASPQRVARATNDGWKINGCPHHGPGLALGRDGTTHMVWFTGAGPRGAGTFYGRIDGQGRAVGLPRPLTKAIGAHADVHVRGEGVILVWKDAPAQDGATVMASVSKDGGTTFTSPRAIAQTKGASDQPFLIESSDGVYLSWFTTAEQHRIIRIEH